MTISSWEFGQRQHVAARLQLRGPRFTDTSRIDGINPIGSMGNALA